MALILCPECSKQFSNQAASCPNCGFQNKELQVLTTSGVTGKFLDPASNMRSCLGCIAVVIIGFVLLLILGLFSRI